MLAAVALLGIGAAVTAAAWEDQVNFEVDASARGSIDLQGRVATSDDLPEDGDWGVWQESDNPVAPELTVSFSDLLPGQTRTFWIEIQNLGSGDAALELGGVEVDDSLTACAGAGAEYYLGWFIAYEGTSNDPWNPDATTVAAGSSTDAVRVEMTVAEDWSGDCAGESGAIRFQILGRQPA